MIYDWNFSLELEGLMSTVKFWRLTIRDVTSRLGNIYSWYEKQEKNSGFLTIFKEDVEQDDADLVTHTDVGVQQNGYNEPHRVLYLLTLCIYAHRQILKEKKQWRTEVQHKIHFNNT